MSVSCDYDPASVYNRATVKAAKDHRCSECHGVICKGEQHELVKGCWDGSWMSFRTCSDCVHLRCQLTQSYGEGGCGWLHGGMIDEIENCAYNAAHDEQAAKFLAMFNAVATIRGARRIDATLAEGNEP